MKQSFWMFMLVGALTGACGGSEGSNPQPNNNPDASVNPMPDDGSPAADIGQPDSQTTPPVDAAVDPDVPSPPVDMPGSRTDCWRQLCGRVRVITIDGMTYERTVNCPPSGNQIGLSPLSCIATCEGDGCSCVLEESDPPNMNAIVTNDRAMAGNDTCGDEFTISYNVAGMPMQPSNGTAVRLRRM